MTEAINQGKFDPIHGLPWDLWENCPDQKLAIKLLPQLKELKKKYYFLEAMIRVHTFDNYKAKLKEIIIKLNQADLTERPDISAGINYYWENM